MTYPLFSTAFEAYSTWNTRPSGENCETDRSYPVPMDDMAVTANETQGYPTKSSPVE